MLQYPGKFMLSSGSGFSEYRLVAFDNALIDAKISNYNLLKVSSILPIGCKQETTIDKKEGSALLVAYGSISSDVSGERIASAVAVGIPEDENLVGVIMEFSGKCDAKEAEDTVCEMAKVAMNNHNIACKEILCSSKDAVVPLGGYASVISAISMW